MTTGRFRQLFEEHVDFVARTLRRLGVGPMEVEDATQEVFVVASRKLDRIEEGTEKAFLFGTAMRLASNARRSNRRNKVTLGLDPSSAPAALPAADEMLEQRRARELLDAVLDTLQDDTRAVFVLREMEGLTVPEIAALLSIPEGTVASRLRRAQGEFDAEVARIQAGKGATS